MSFVQSFLALTLLNISFTPPGDLTDHIRPTNELILSQPHSFSDVVYFRTGVRRGTRLVRLMEDRGTRERLEPREQYGNNLGRKPSQVIPNDPKSAPL